ncbi:hypothetical protein KOR34_18340 [Posidoniimonas corsicana]|uniref:Uncharacterized protein n=1 Tax=Posidoniimonas corsicana TaxID=1938618 RepID=A0A5C5VG59_9BACT|nr:hypothetical protein [Posidoniimonas corsicana]TWT36889.1 hypothetical protein KOR34_18340 [Posidoniimonas corsicana]
MSTFVHVTRYSEAAPQRGEVRNIGRRDIESAVASLPGYKLIEQDGDLIITLPGTQAALIKEGPSLSCRIDPQTSVDELLSRLRVLAAKIPGAVVEDEQNETY